MSTIVLENEFPWRSANILLPHRSETHATASLLLSSMAFDDLCTRFSTHCLRPFFNYSDSFTNIKTPITAYQHLIARTQRRFNFLRMFTFLLNFFLALCEFEHHEHTQLEMKKFCYRCQFADPVENFNTAATRAAVS